MKFHDTPRTRDQNVTCPETYRGDRVGECHVPDKSVAACQEKSWPRYVMCGVSRGPFLESPGNFLGPKSQSKISNLTISELFYSHIFNMKKGSLHTRSFRLIHFSVFRYR